MALHEQSAGATDEWDLAEERAKRFLCELEHGKYPALAAGSAPVRKLMAWMEEGGMFDTDVVAMLIYNAAAKIFRRADTPEQAEQFVRQTFEVALADLRMNGPEA